MRAGAFVSVALAVATAGGGVALAVVSATCTGCGKLPSSHTPPPVAASASPSPASGGVRLTRALLTRVGGGHVTQAARSGTYGALAGVPLPRGAVRNALTGHGRTAPAGCGPWPSPRWSGPARNAPAATVTLTVARSGGGATWVREALFRPVTRPAGLGLPARCRAYRLAGGAPARSAALAPAGVGDAARGVVTVVGRHGSPHRAALYTIVFRVGKVYGVVGVAGTGRAPGGAAVRRLAYVYARRAATRTRGLT